MKCIKLISDVKGSEIGTITRVSDLVAYEKVLAGTHVYVPKSEWKSLRVTKPVDNVKKMKDKPKKVKETKKEDNPKNPKKEKQTKKTEKKKH